MRRLRVLAAVLAMLLVACGSAEARRNGMITGTAMFVGGAALAGIGAATAEPGDALALPAVGGVASFAGLVTFMASSIPPSTRVRTPGMGGWGGGTTPDTPSVSATTFAARCDAGDALGCYELGRAFLTGTGGVRMNHDAACAAFDAACGGGYEGGCTERDANCR